MTNLPPDVATLGLEEKRALLAKLLAQKLEAPLSMNQRSLWFLEQLDPGRPTYHIHTAFRLEGDLDVAALEWSLGQIIARHDTLRSTFHSDAGEPKQRSARAEPLKLSAEVLPEMTADEREEILAKLAREEAFRPIDLSQGPLWAVRLVRLAPNDHVLFVKMHHIISDGWSVGVLSRELAALYQAHRTGVASPLPPLPAQYADYVRWQREREKSGEFERDLAYWREKLHGCAESLDVPTRGPRPAVQTHRGGHRRAYLPEPLIAAAKSLGRSEQSTLFVVLLAAFKAVLARHSRQTDVVVGSPVANRLRPEFEPLIGYFSNMVALRDEVSPELSFRELVRRVRRTTQEALSRQDVPLERLVQELKPRRDPSRHPIFQVMFVLQAGRMDMKRSLNGLTIGPFKLGTETTKFDLQLSCNPRPEGFQVKLAYNKDLYDGATMARLIDHLRAFLTQALAEPDRPIGEVSLMDAGERDELIVRRNQTQLAFDGPKTVHELFERQVAERPDAPAIEQAGRVLTYGELDALANRIARRLRTLGVSRDRTVGVALDRSIEMVAAFLGAMKAGGAYLPLDPQLPAARVELILSDAAPAVVIADREGVARLASVGTTAPIVSLDDLLTSDDASESPLAGEATTNDLAYVLYTSGSTGRPKGVAVEHRSVVNYIHAARRLYGIDDRDRVLQFASASHDAHVEEIYPVLASGGTLVLRTDDMLDSYETLLRGCETTHVTVASWPTAYWHELTAALVDGAATKLPDSLRAVILGGERAWSERVAQWFDRVGDRVALFNTYGPTEATVIATGERMTHPRESDGALRRAPIGSPIANVKTYVLDDAQRPVPIGAPGELYIGGDCLARGYLNRPELTAERFLPDPFSDVAGARMYRTGDLVRWLPDGPLDFLGRTDGQVKIRGFRIEPGEVEAVLSAHPSVAQAAVVARRVGEEFQLIAYAATHDEATPTSIELRRHLEGRLPHYLVPAVVVKLPSLPTNAAGKVDRHALPAPDVAVGRGEIEPPVGEDEEAIAAVFCETLRIPQIGRHENFFELGGHSLLAVQLLSRLRQRRGEELKLATLLAGPTVAQTAEALRRPIDDPQANASSQSSGDSAAKSEATNADAATPNRRGVLFGRPSPNPLVTLRAGDRWRQPVLLIPGLGGRVEIFRTLAENLLPGHPILGLQARGLDGIEKPHRSLKSAMTWGLELVAKAGYEPPMLVGGMSMGGLAALEAAHQLRAAKRPAQLVLLLDTHPPRNRPAAPEGEEAARLAAWLGLDPTFLAEAPEAKRRELLLAHGQQAGVIPPDVELAHLDGLANVYRAQFEAMATFQERRDPGAILFVQAGLARARDRDPETFDAVPTRWRELFPALQILRVPTHHNGVLQPPHVNEIVRRTNLILQTAPDAPVRPGAKT